MVKKRRRLWVVLFIFVAFLLSVLATSWNLFLVREYRQMLDVSRWAHPSESAPLPWFVLPFGSFGFALTFTTVIVFFIKILHEMKLNQLQSEFLATVTHELKTPLAAIDLSSSLIRSGVLTPEETESLWKTHEQELQRLRGDVEAILEAARWQSQPIALKPKKIHLESWLSESMSRWKTILGPSSILVRKGENLDSQAMLDTKTLSLITDNLLDNARKFSKGTPKVTILTRRVPPKGFWSPGYWQIRIKDEGWGFDPSESKKIFDRFFRSRSAPYAIPGTGLGLYLASSACKAMGISISGFSRGKGKGAVFTLKGLER